MADLLNNVGGIAGAPISNVGGPRLVSPPPPPGGDLLPSSQWTGTAGTGFGGANPPTPVPTLPTAAGPTLALLNLNWNVLTADGKFWAAASSDTASVQFALEGNFETISSRTSETYVDINGNMQTLPSVFACSFDIAEWLAINPDGKAALYLIAISSVVGKPNTIIGPFFFYARSTRFTTTKTVGTGGDFNGHDLTPALQYVRDHASERVLIRCLDTANYSINNIGASFLTPEWWTVIQGTVGMTCTMGAGNNSVTQCGFDGLMFEGQYIYPDIAKLSYNLTGWRFTNGGVNRLAFNGTSGPFCGAADPAHGGSGSGAAALINGDQPSIYWINGNAPTSEFNVYFMDLTAHDLPAYGLSFHRLRRNANCVNASGSDDENYGWTYGGYSDQIGGYYNGLRTEQGAFDLVTSLGGTVEYEKTGANGNSGFFNIYVSSPTPTYQIATGGTVTAMIASINALGTPGDFTATPTASTNDLNTRYLSRADLTPSAAIPKTTLVGTANITRIADIHADVHVLHGGGPITYVANRLVQFHENRRSVGTAWCSNNGDVPNYNMSFCWNSNQDISASVSEATQPGYMGGAFTNMDMKFNSNTDPNGLALVTGVSFDATDYSHINHCATVLSWSGTPDAHLQIQSLAAPVLPAGADGNSKVVSANPALLYVNPATNPPDFTPINNGPLKLTDASYAGRYLPSGAEQGL